MVDDVPVDVDRLDLLSELFQHIPILGFGEVGGFTEVSVQLVEPEKLRLVGPIHGWGGVEVKAVLVSVAEVEKVCRSDEGIVDRMQGSPGNGW